MKHTLWFFAVCWAASLSFADDDPAVPPGINYTKTSAEINGQAKDKIRKLYTSKATDKDVLSLFENKALICGPGLWRQIRNDPVMAKIEGGKVAIKIPLRDAAGKITRVQELEGKLFKADKDVLAFWKVVAAKADFSDLTIRKLNTAELKILWMMISFDITEPIFVVEGKHHKILMLFRSPQELSVMWIDDFQDMALEKKDPPKP